MTPPPQPPPGIPALMLEALIRIEAKLDLLSARLDTHIAASVAERRDVRRDVQVVEANVQAIHTETRQIAATLRRVQLRVDALGDDPYADLEVRERAA